MDLHNEWVQLYRENSLIQLNFEQHQIETAEFSVPYSLSVNKLNNNDLILSDDFGIEIERNEVAIQLRFSLFHTPTRQFFGKTFATQPVFFGKKMKTIHFSEEIYYHSRINSGSCLCILEVVASFGPQTVPLSLGWTVFHPFGSDLRDKSDVKNMHKSQKNKFVDYELFRGTPRSLCLLKFSSINELKTLISMTSSSIQLNVSRFSALEDIKNFIPENMLFSKNIHIPGISMKHLRPKKNLTSIVLDGISLTFPDSFDSEFLLLTVNNMAKEINSHFDPHSIYVKQRQISVGLHNGYKFVSVPHVCVLRESKGNFVSDHTMVLKNYLHNGNFVVIIEVQIVINFPLVLLTPNESQFSTINKGLPSSVSRTIPVGSAIIFYDGFSNQVRYKLQSGPIWSVFNEDYVMCFPEMNERGESIMITLDIANETQIGQSISKSRREDREFGKKRYEKIVVEDEEDSMEQIETQIKNLSMESPNEEEEEEDLDEGERKRHILSIPSALPNERFMKFSLIGDFPQYRDDNQCEVPDLMGRSVEYDPNIELNDHRKKNAIRFLFMGFSTTKNSMIKPNVRKLMFTFTFHHFPMTKTGTVILRPTNQIHNKVVTDIDKNFVFQREEFYNPNQNENENVGRNGLEEQFYVSGFQFLNYLSTKRMQIDVWDADSLFHYGHCVVPVCSLLRHGRPAVQNTVCFEVVLYSNMFSSTPVSERVFTNGYLYLNLVNIGFVDDELVSTPNTNLLDFQRISNSTNTIFAKRLIEADPEFSLYLQKVKRNETENNQINCEDEIKAQKIQRLKQRFQPRTNPMRTQQLEKERELIFAHDYREKTKRRILMEKLRLSTIFHHTLNVSFGSTQFFELSFENTYSEIHEFSITIEGLEDNERLEVVRSIEEWNILRNKFNCKSEKAIRTVVDHENKIRLKPFEKVLIPFRYQSFRSGVLIPLGNNTFGNGNVDDPLGKIPRGAPISKHDVHVVISNVRNIPNLTLELCISPLPFCIDRTFRFFCSENESFERSIDIVQNYPNEHIPKYYVKCYGNPLVRFEQRLNNRSEQQISFHIRISEASNNTAFFFLLYEEQYFITPSLILQVIIYPYNRKDIVCTIGESNTFSFPLDIERVSFGVFPSNERVKYISSEKRAISFKYKAFADIPDFTIIHVVDSSIQELICGFLVFVTQRRPIITREHRIEFNDLTKTKRKHLNYTNVFPYTKLVTIEVSNPDAVSVLEPSKFTLESQLTSRIGLIFRNPVGRQGDSARTMLFVNDGDDKTLDAYSFEIVYKG